MTEIGSVVRTRNWKEYPEKMTAFLFLTCIVASSGGLLLGYDIGIFSGVTYMGSFLHQFFPSLYRQQEEDSIPKNEYCKFHSELLTLFISCIFLAALFAAFFVATVTRVFGRKWSMFSGGVVFLIGTALNGTAVNLLMLIMGRILLGVGVGFVYHSAPLYLSEMAPAKIRGMLNILFQLMVSIGVLAGHLVDYWATQMDVDRGWRLSLTLAAVPGVIFAVGALALPDTPVSLIVCGHEAAAKAVLRKARGTDQIEEEFRDLMIACNYSRTVKYPWKNIAQRRYRPALTMAVLIPFFRQSNGTYVIMFYGPELFKAAGFGNRAAFMSSVIMGVVNSVATTICSISVDKIGRRALLIVGSIQMLVCQLVVGVLIGIKYRVSGEEAELSKRYATMVVIFICLYVSANGLSWGSLGVLIPSEIFPLEIRPEAMSINLSVNMFFTTVSALVFPSMLCNLKFGLFFFYTGWVIIMTTFAVRFLPETKNVPIEEMASVWQKHWFWRKFVPDEALHAGNRRISNHYQQY